ncbi:MAG: class I SAM-dependent methyltransferase [Candidatus Moranbacteria bacterium]|nr:class I SAM-dependent methyltransferase [Candidatus Moranbacteria bacterium]
MKNENIDKILNQTEAGYDQMAEKFSGTRNFFWPELSFIKDVVSEESKILDFGCGNGRLLEILQEKNPQYFGVDISQKLIDLAKQKYPQFAQNFSKISGQPSLAFPDEFFNNIVSVAVFHHFPDQKFRLAMAKELFRVTKPGGKIVVTVWNLWQEKYKKYVWKNRIRKVFFLSQLDWSDCEIPFKNNKGEVFTRFHHAYTKKDLANLFSQAGFEIEKVEVVNNKNLVLVGKRI